VIAFVVSRYDVGRTFWVFHHLIEVDDAIKRAAAANPGVEGHAHLLFVGAVVAFER